MIKKIFKLIIFLLFILSGAFLWVGRKASSYLELEKLDSRVPNFGPDRGVLIIFNSGGWGNTPFDQAEDFNKVIRGIKLTLNKLGWKVAIVSYGRTEDNFLGRIGGMKEILSSFKSQSKKLVGHVKIFLGQNPRSMVLIAGLSLGAHFAGETMKRIGKNSRVFAVKAGTPFWDLSPKSENILDLVNEKDIVATGDYRTLLGIILKDIVRRAASVFKGDKLSFSVAIQMPGHRYDWRLAELREQIIFFLESNFKLS